MKNQPFVCLGQLAKNQIGIVEEISACQKECQRLASMGFCEGACVRMISPGSPCAVQVGETRVVLRGDHLLSIRVCPV